MAGGSCAGVGEGGADVRRLRATMLAETSSPLPHGEGSEMRPIG